MLIFVVETSGASLYSFCIIFHKKMREPKADYTAHLPGDSKATQSPRWYHENLTCSSTVSCVMPVAFVGALDEKGRGLVETGAKYILIEGALQGETVSYSSYRVKPAYELARLDTVHRASALRVAPKCPYFGVCGGCTMQHVAEDAQLAMKQRELEMRLWRVGQVRPSCFIQPVHGSAWGYRHRARLSVRWVAKKGEVLIGFHERKSRYIADMRSCAVLPKAASDLLMPLRSLVESLSIRELVPQIELAMGETGITLVLRVLEALAVEDRKKLKAFAELRRVVLYVQPKGPDTVELLHPPEAQPLVYTLPEYEVSFEFMPTDFTQVNPAMNRVLVRRAMQLLEPQPGERIADLFCGLGNFSLPIARCGAQVVGIEHCAPLLMRARLNAERHGLAERTRFVAANLYVPKPRMFDELAGCDKILLDPPREGAIEFIKALGQSKVRPWRIVYVSCNPATLARDAAVLTHELGWHCQAAGVFNLFPHTAHVESIALFSPKQQATC